MRQGGVQSIVRRMNSVTYDRCRRLGRCNESIRSPGAVVGGRASGWPPARSGAVRRSYGPRYEEFFRQAARYVDRILRGAKPGKLRVVLPTKFDFVVNLKTARELVIRIPQSVLLRADRVIE